MPTAEPANPDKSTDRSAASSSDTDRLQAEIAALQRALQSSRRIGAAIGVLMALRKLSYEEAFKQLSEASQRTNRKVSDLAEDILYLGDF